MFEEVNKNAIYFVVAIIAAVAIMMTAVFPIWNLFPNNVTETVKVVAVDENGCTIETSDEYIIHISPCNAKPGDSITATYDAKIKQRIHAFLP